MYTIQIILNFDIWLSHCIVGDFYVGMLIGIMLCLVVAVFHHPHRQVNEWVNWNAHHSATALAVLAQPALSRAPQVPVLHAVRSSLLNTWWAYCMPYHAVPQDGLQGVGVAMWWGKVRWGTACSIGKQGPQPQYLPSQTKLFIPIYFLFIVVYTSQLSAKGHS